MRKTVMLATLAIALSTSACSKDPKARLQGKWIGESLVNVPESQAGEALGWAKGVTFEFNGTKMTVTVPSEEPRVGEFDIQDAKKDRVTIRVAREGGDTGPTTLVFAQDDHLHWDIGEGREVVMTRLP